MVGRNLLPIPISYCQVSIIFYNAVTFSPYNVISKQKKGGGLSTLLHRSFLYLIGMLELFILTSFLDMQAYSGLSFITLRKK